MAGWSQGSPGWQAYLQSQAAPQASGPAGDPTASPGFVVNQSQPLTQAQISQWQNYFNTGAGAGGTPQMVPQQVQTGTTWAPTNPGLLGNAGLLNNLSALGIQQGANPQATAANINASPLTGNFSGISPTNPYYSQILAQMGQGTVTPTYGTKMVPAGGGGGGNWAQMVGGQLIGNATPQEQALAQYFGMGQNQTQYLPDMLNAYAAAPAGTLTSATVPMFNASTLFNAGDTQGLTPQEQQNYLASISGVRGQ